MTQNNISRRLFIGMGRAAKSYRTYVKDFLYILLCVRVFRIWGPKLGFGVLCDLRAENLCLRLQVFGNNAVLFGDLTDVCGDLTALKMEAVVSSQTSAENYQSARRYVCEFIH